MDATVRKSSATKRSYASSRGSGSSFSTRKRSRRGTGRKAGKPSIESVVRSVLNRAAEMKSAMIFKNVAYTGGISTTSDATQIFPTILQGTTEYGSRIGNKIKLFKLAIKGYINIQQPATTLADGKYLVRALILRQKNENDWSAVASGGFNYQQLLIDSTEMNGTVTAIMKPINEDAFAAKMDIVKFMTTPTDVGVEDQPNSLVEFTCTFSFPKGKVVSYADDTAGTPNDWPWFFTLGWTYPNGYSTGLSTNVIAVYTSTALYTDV